MQRGSDEHSPRVDDQLASEVDALVHGAPDEGRTESRRQEDLPIGDGVIDGAHRSDAGPPEPGLEERDLDLRAAVAASLTGTVFPATAAVLRERARENSASDDVLAVLDALPRDASMRLSARSGPMGAAGDDPALAGPSCPRRP